MSVEFAHGVPDLGPEDKGRLNWSPKVNYIEKRGGLPPYLNSVANALVRKGWTRARAIATAVNVMKKTCATGHWGGHPNQPISGAIQAAACGAVARWKAITASTSIPADQRVAIELATLWDDEGTLELAWNRLRARRALALARRVLDETKRIDLAATTFKPWDGSPSRFTDEEYRRSCIVKGPAPYKQNCHLPVREPNGTLNCRGVAAAKGRLGQVKGDTSGARAKLDRLSAVCERARSS